MPKREIKQGDSTERYLPGIRLLDRKCFLYLVNTEGFDRSNRLHLELGNNLRG